MLSTRITQLTVPSSDNGKRFIQTERLDLIRNALETSKYRCIANLPLAKVYRHHGFKVGRPAMLISCHIDSIYKNYFASSKNGEYHGTFDNSVCNAVIVEAMLKKNLPAQVLVSFTGDEEEDALGVDQTIEYLEKEELFDSLEMVIILDITEQHYGACHYTIENCFAGQNHNRGLLRFDRNRDLKAYLKGMIGSPVFVKNADEDESWRYEESDLNCFTLCLPCRLLGEDMHDDTGVAISKDSPLEYLKALEQLTRSVHGDLASR